MGVDLFHTLHSTCTEPGLQSKEGCGRPVISDLPGKFCGDVLHRMKTEAKRYPRSQAWPMGWLSLKQDNIARYGCVLSMEKDSMSMHELMLASQAGVPKAELDESDERLLLARIKDEASAPSMQLAHSVNAAATEGCCCCSCCLSANIAAARSAAFAGMLATARAEARTLGLSCLMSSACLTCSGKAAPQERLELALFVGWPRAAAALFSLRWIRLRTTALPCSVVSIAASAGCLTAMLLSKSNDVVDILHGSMMLVSISFYRLLAGRARRWRAPRAQYMNRLSSESLQACALDTGSKVQ
jgi:hypothetical protein